MLTRGSFFTSVFGRFRLFWVVNARLSWLSFALKVLRLRWIQARRHTLASQLAARSIAKRIFSIFLAAITCVIAIYGLGFALRKFAAKLAYLTWLSQVTAWFASLEISPSTYDSLLAAVASICGVFIALYLTTITTIAAAAYSTLPSDVRDLLSREKINNTALSIVSFTGAVAILLLGARGLGLGVTILGIVMISLLSCFSLFCFVYLGRRAFYFFDPTVLVGLVIHEFHEQATSASSKGHYFRDPSFQNHYRKLAAHALANLQPLVEAVAARAELRQTSLPALVNTTLAYLPEYVILKRLIPTESAWYPRIGRHKEWYLSEISEAELSWQTYTIPRPILEPNPYWVENEVWSVTKNSLGSLLEQGLTSSALQIVDSLNDPIETLGSEWEVTSASEWLVAVSEQVVGKLRSWPLGPDYTDEQNDLALAAVDGLGRLAISFWLGLCRSVADMQKSGVLGLLTSSNLIRSHWKLRAGLPTQIGSTLENLRERVAFETLAEGRIVSPDWYVSELIRRELSERLLQALTKYLEVAENLYMGLPKRLAERGVVVPASCLVTRGLEASRKIKANLSEFRELVESLGKGRLISKLRWPNWDWQALEKRTDTLRLEQAQLLSKCIPKLATEQRKQNWPDFFGWAVQTAGMLSFELLEHNRREYLKEIFPLYFGGALSACDRILKRTEGWEPESAVALTTEPIMDLLDLSGYSMIFAQLHGEDRLWTVCEHQWDNYLADEQGVQRLRRIAAILRLHRTRPFISTRSVYRTTLQMRTRAAMSKIPWIPGEQFYHPGQPDHASPLIKIIAPSPDDIMMVYDGLDVFEELYLAVHPKASSNMFELRHGLREHMERLKGNEDA